MDGIFKAIDDAGRRTLLDGLFEHDGQTLTELCSLLPDMTRYGVMSHLRVLEEAHLITTKKEGRFKYHYLNPVPIKQISERWISKYAEPRVTAMGAIAARFERRHTMPKPAHVYQAYIRASVEEVWQAIIDGDKTVQYFYGTRVESDWEPGSPMNYYDSNGGLVSEGEIISIDAPKRIEFTFQALWDPELIEEGPAREVWAIRDVNGMAELTIELYDVTVGDKTYEDFVGGFPYIVSGMKSLLETGAGLPSPY